jgi:hypothetical protein
VMPLLAVLAAALPAVPFVALGLQAVLVKRAGCAHGETSNPALAFL